jgi:hypothetical protein
MAASYNVASRYYTKNGLPLDEDPEFDVNFMHTITMTPASDDPEYEEWRGILQPGRETVRFNLNREPRFYANVAISAGYWRTQFVRIRTMMFEDQDGGRQTGFSSAPYDYYCTGIACKKFVHPESKSQQWQRVVRYPLPIIRLADLYLMKAEALNEYLDAPNQEVWDAINIVRERAGIPTVEESWANASKTPGKHTQKIGMRDIILHERGIELSFEGHRFWDMHRHKRAVYEFSKPIWGWNAVGRDAATFFILGPKQTRLFTVKDHLWPIDLNELNTNGNLKQNPGW